MFAAKPQRFETTNVIVSEYSSPKQWNAERGI